MKLSLWISRRLRLDLSGFGRTGAVIAVAGVALAVIVMELALAIITGFKDEIRRKVAGFDDQIAILAPFLYTGEQEQSAFAVSPELMACIAEVLPQATVEPVLRVPAMLKTDNDFEGLLLVARDTRTPRNFELNNIVAGEWPDFNAPEHSNSIVISTIQASKLGLAVGDKVFSTFVVNDAVKLRRSTVAGIYSSNFGDYDKSVAYASPSMLRNVCSLDSTGCTLLAINGTDQAQVDSNTEALRQNMVRYVWQGDLPSMYQLTNINRSAAAYFDWLALLDTNVAVILALMMAVCGFTLISSLFILILSHIRTIGIMRAMGASKRLIRSIFLTTALRLTIKGLIIGNCVALLLLTVQKYTKAVPLNPEMYYLDSVPVEINIPAFVALNVGVVLLSWLILVLPARMASAVDPARTVTFD